MSEEITERIRRLVEGMNKLELQIASATDAIKDCYLKASTAMPEDKSYFLNGIQTGPVVKSYLLTNHGIDIPGEAPLEIPEFIDSVLRFANYPKRKIEVLSDLCNHLENIYATIHSKQTQ